MTSRPLYVLFLFPAILFSIALAATSSETAHLEKRWSPGRCSFHLWVNQSCNPNTSPGSKPGDFTKHTYVYIEHIIDGKGNPIRDSALASGEFNIRKPPHSKQDPYELTYEKSITLAGMAQSRTKGLRFWLAPGKDGVLEFNYHRKTNWLETTPQGDEGRALGGSCGMGSWTRGPLNCDNKADRSRKPFRDGKYNFYRHHDSDCWFDCPGISS